MRTGFSVKIAICFAALGALACALAVFGSDTSLRTALEIVGALLSAIALVSLFIAVIWLSQLKAKSIVQKWAAENGHVILHYHRPLCSGAFPFWTTSRGQTVFLVTLRGKEGAERKAWLRCGSFWGGIHFSDQIEVKWDDESNEAK